MTRCSEEAPEAVGGQWAAPRSDTVSKCDAVCFYTEKNTLQK